VNVTLIIPTYRNPTYLDLCLKSAVENRVSEDNHILVIVDGFIEESQTVLDKYPGIRYLDIGTNKGMQHALNVGVMQAETELVFIANDDNVLGRKWDEDVLYAFKQSDNYRLIGQVMTVNQVEPTGPGMFNHSVYDLGQNVNSFQYENWLDLEESISKNIVRVDGHIFPFVTLKKHYMAVGGLDTFYDSPNICDWDFFLKLELLGFSFTRTEFLHLYHFGSVSTKKNAESQLFRNRESEAIGVYEFKWGAHPFNKPNSNSKIPPDKHFRGFTI
jgi:glycosyltransferase involved in cell wall biosynthesis